MTETVQSPSWSGNILALLREGTKDYQYLLNRGYNPGPALTFIGNHYRLTALQRLAVRRNTDSTAALAARKEKEVSFSYLRGKKIALDGFNLVITLETALKGGLLLSCEDGTIRDLAGLHGSYHISPLTEQVLSLLYDFLKEAGLRDVVIYIDRPMHSSGKLKDLWSQSWSGAPFSVRFILAKDVDLRLYEEPLVATSDSVILDHCRKWYSLAGAIAEKEKFPVLRLG